ncbi:MAG: adenylosuccinate synthase [Pseudomonadota bacterium]
MAKNIVVVGAQWGDEGKGRIVDLLTPSVDAVVRYQGGANAGHTVIIGNRKTVLHLVPSGILHADCFCAIGNGVVLDANVLIDEIEGLFSQNYLKNPKMLAVSTNAHLVMPYHRIIDQLRETQLGDARIGTTGRGIGPAYEDKASRLGIRFGEMLDKDVFQKRLELVLPQKNKLIESLGGKPVALEDLLFAAQKWRQKLAGHACDVSLKVDELIKQGKKILFEGAQGTALDIDHGTYPYVTSSNTVAGQVCCGVGIGPSVIDAVLGIVKAYTTRVGEGPFPTEDHGLVAKHLQTKGNEFGATTGRQRRCGWFDAVLLKHAKRVNGLTLLALTKLDVLSGLDTVRICTGYEFAGKQIDYLPPDYVDLEKCQPIYEDHKGWKEDISNIRDFKNLPKTVQDYINCIQEIATIPVAIVSVGPERGARIILKDPFA